MFWFNLHISCIPCRKRSIIFKSEELSRIYELSYLHVSDIVKFFVLGRYWLVRLFLLVSVTIPWNSCIKTCNLFSTQTFKVCPYIVSYVPQSWLCSWNFQFFVIITLTELQKLKSKNLVIQVLVYFATGENCQEFHPPNFQK